ncbi:hypothetical protein [Roseofilum capinflatum]|uniref:Abortive infection protein-like C-terminal domain-containing protein n=1 Tax=Roseofilum capinflatum BLCC-M114 TaxID=3022440 RepID=A0ABT7B5N3_9CYAN|nr:hypothetical protein [Roseofilum capinflatum]MDJ1174478.1 hypothetical protein [Roseofilum capinflatum BLCC-M114]
MINKQFTESLRRKIDLLKLLMIQYVTDERKDGQPDGYKKFYSEIWSELKDLNWENPNPYKSLEAFWVYCRKNLNTYAERRAYVEDLYADILLKTDELERRSSRSRHWKKANNLLKDELDPVRIQWQKAKNFIYSANPDYENAIKEAINSIESCLKILLNEPRKTLGYLIKSDNLDADIAKLVSQAYGIASNKNGIRHGGTSIENLSKDEAEFFLDFCAIAIIYIIAKLKK